VRVSNPFVAERGGRSSFTPTRWREAHHEAMADQFDSKTILRLLVPTILLIFFAVIGLTASLCNSAGGKEALQPVNLGINGSDDVPECNESMSVMRSLLHVSVKELISTSQLNRSIPARGQRNEEIRLGGIQLISFLCGYFFRSTQWERRDQWNCERGCSTNSIEHGLCPEQASHS
jgi:hypothetical protein